jgi:hypothetical protein
MTEKLYIPYSGKKPAHITVNGHRVVILSSDPAILNESLSTLGADAVKELKDSASVSGQRWIKKIAKSSNAHIVVTTEAVEIDEVIKNLENELPWIH